MGYNEPRQDGPDDRSGSHYVVVGSMLNFSRFGGVVAGLVNTGSGAHASVTGGEGNEAGGDFSSVSGGTGRTAPGTENWAAGALFEAQ